MSALFAVQQSIFTVLDGAAGVTSLLADNAFAVGKKAIYDRVPQAADGSIASAFPYVVIGDDTATEWDTDDTHGQETTITLHVWSRYRGKKEMKQIMDAVYDALHDASLTVAGHQSVFSFFDFAESFQDPDGVTQHGVIRFRIATVSVE